MWLYLHQLWLIVINLQYPAINQTKKGNCFNSNILYSSLLFQTFLQKYIIKILLMTSCLINTKQNGNVSKYQVFFPTPLLTLRTMKIWIPLPAGNGGKKVVWALIYGRRLETCLIYGFRLGFDWKRLRPNISGCARTGHNYYYFVAWRRVSKWKIKLRPGLIFQCRKVSFFFFFWEPACAVNNDTITQMFKTEAFHISIHCLFSIKHLWPSAPSTLSSVHIAPSF